MSSFRVLTAAFFVSSSYGIQLLPDVESLQQHPSPHGLQVDSDDGRDEISIIVRDVFLFAGQSNCVGQGQISELPAAYQSPPTNIYSTRNNATWGKWEPTNPSGKFGPDLSFGTKMATGVYKNTNFGVIKSATSGSGLESKWLNHSAGKGPLVDILISRAKKAKVAHGCKNGGCSLKALFWVQGEEDARFLNASSHYRANLELLISKIRRRLDEPHLFIVIAELPRDGSVSEEVGANSVRRAQHEFVKAQGPRLAALVRTTGLPRLPDSPKHYTAEALIELGTRLAAAYLSRPKI